MSAHTQPPGTAPKPADIEEYRIWLEEVRGAGITSEVEAHFETVLPLIQSQFEVQAVWRDIGRLLPDWDALYRGVHADYALLAGEIALPKLSRKSFASFLSKTYRRNVLTNVAWPDAPPEGWVVFPAWYSQVNDIVRATFTVKYLDGVETLVGHIREAAEANGIKTRSYFQATTDGYYAAHVYLRSTFSLPNLAFVIESVDVEIELQITTQLQDVIKLLIHRYYKEHREEHDFGDRIWQWDHKSDEFATNYLGHILHYVEGMILDVRDRQIAKGA